MLKWLARLFYREDASKKAERKKAVERLIFNHQRRLRILKEQQALPANPSIPPHVLMEIEDIELKIQQLKAELAAGGPETAKTEAVLAAHQRRLEMLRKTEPVMGTYEQEIEAIEATIERLKAELKQLSRRGKSD